MQEAQFIPYNAVTKVEDGPVLVLAPHADDEVFGCAGAIASHIAAGDFVQVVILTNGAAGSGTSEIREQESHAAADLLGVTNIHFWNLPDRGLEKDDALIERIINIIDTENIRLLYAPSPAEIHPDHRVVADMAIDIVRSRSETKLAFYEVSAPLAPNRLLDITPYLELKKQAMMCFVSQLEGHRYDAFVTGLNNFRAMTLQKEVLSAEAFWLISSEELQEANPVQTLYPIDQRVVKEKSLVNAHDNTIGNLDNEIMETMQRLQILMKLKQADSSELQSNYEALKADIDAQKERLEKITNSKSWRWTKIFRALFGKDY